MFTGIVEAVGTVVRVAPAPHSGAAATGAQRLEIDGRGLFTELRPGASAAVNGACLTLTEARGQAVGCFDVIPETWRNTGLHLLHAGDPVNLERSLRIGDRLDGHFVQGHVDGVGAVQHLDRSGQWKLWVSAPRELMPYIVRKGSIALDGVSLTVVDVTDEAFSVALIPVTLAGTVLGRRQPGDAVNIETDILARLVLSRVGAMRKAEPPSNSEGLTLEGLRERGFA